MRKLLILALLLSSTALAQLNIHSPNGVIGQPYSGGISNQTGSNDNCVSWGFTGGTMPPGLAWTFPNGSANADTAITGTPTARGTYSFGVSAYDPCYSTNYSATVTIYISSVGITTPTLNIGNVGIPFNDAIGDNSASLVSCLRWTVLTGTLPAGLTLTNVPPANYYTTLAGTPAGPPGAYPFTVKLTDSCTGDYATQAYTMSIGTNTPPVTVGASGLPAVAGAWANVQATWRDSGGWATIVQHDVMITHTSIGFPYSNRCYIALLNSTQIYLYNDAGTAWLTPVVMGTATFLSNASCTIDAANSSYTSKSGTDMTASIRVRLTSAFASAGDANLYIHCTDSQYASTWDLYQTKTILLSSGARLIVTTYH